MNSVMSYRCCKDAWAVCVMNNDGTLATLTSTQRLFCTQKLVAAFTPGIGITHQCMACQTVIKTRVTAQLPPPRSHCMRNETWLKGNSSWGPGSEGYLDRLQEYCKRHELWSAADGMTEGDT